jgi:hypothetical protein
MVWIPEGIVIKLNHYTRKSKENSMQSKKGMAVSHDGTVILILALFPC